MTYGLRIFLISQCKVNNSCVCGATKSFNVGTEVTRLSALARSFSSSQYRTLDMAGSFDGTGALPSLSLFAQENLIVINLLVYLWTCGLGFKHDKALSLSPILFRYLRLSLCGVAMNCKVTPCHRCALRLWRKRDAKPCHIASRPTFQTTKIRGRGRANGDPLEAYANKSGFLFSAPLGLVGCFDIGNPVGGGPV